MSNFETHTQEHKGVWTHYIYTKKINLSIPILTQWLKRRQLLKAYETGFKNLLRERGQIHLIHLNVVMPAGFGALLLHKKYNIPYVVNEGWTGYMKEDGSYRGFFSKYFTKKIIQSAAYILPVSKDLQEAMELHGLKGKYKILPNVIQTAIFDIQTASAQVKQQANGATFIHVSTFDSRQKNVTGIINAFKEALEKKPDLSLLLVGDAEDTTELLRHIKLNKLESKVSLVGKRSADELAVLFNQCKALVMFSNYESFGVVIGEALACGLPVICSRVGGLGNSLSPELGITIEPNNEEQLSAAMLKIAGGGTTYDRNFLRNFITKRFSEAVIAQELKNLYQEVISQK